VILTPKFLNGNKNLRPVYKKTGFRNIEWLRPFWTFCLLNRNFLGDSRFSFLAKTFYQDQIYNFEIRMNSRIFDTLFAIFEEKSFIS
jgi:hypothetical protein